MNLIFFQNCISPHQIPYIKELPKQPSISKVIVVAPIINYEFRSNMGWDTHNLLSSKDIEFIIAPSTSQVETLIYNYSESYCHCIFSGINAFPEVAEWLRLSLKYKVKRSIVTEAPFVYHKPIWMHAVRFLLQDYRYTKYLDNVFVMGNKYLWYYRFWSKRWNVVPFMYCTESIKRTMMAPEGKSLKILYVGSLIKRKNVKLLLRASRNFNNIEVGIVGDGDQRVKLLPLATKNVTFFGSISISEVPTYVQKYDVLVLPSFYDGWGAVVNEALNLGLYVICSDSCGASSIINNSQIGIVFKNNNIHSLKKALEYCKDNLLMIRESINYRAEWSKCNLSGSEIAKYFIRYLNIK
jgi:glycosyltransferase involved in cell wall biosynthesis